MTRLAKLQVDGRIQKVGMVKRLPMKTCLIGLLKIIACICFVKFRGCMTNCTRVQAFLHTVLCGAFVAFVFPKAGTIKGARRAERMHNGHKGSNQKFICPAPNTNSDTRKQEGGFFTLSSGFWHTSAIFQSPVRYHWVVRYQKTSLRR